MNKQARNFLIILVGFYLIFTVMNVLFFDYRDYIDPVSFDEMEYSRTDVESLCLLMDDAAEAAQRNDKDKTIELLSEVSEGYTEFYTMLTLSDIRYSLDLSDEFYAEEYSFNLQASADVENSFDSMCASMASSDLSRVLEKEFFSDGFFDSYKDYDAEASEELTQLFIKENKLISDYRATRNNSEFEYEGETVSYAFFMSDEFPADDFDSAEKAFYAKYNPILGEIYVELVKTRMEIADMLGYESYTDYAYEAIHRRDYTPADTEKYIADISEKLSPIYTYALENKLWGELSYRDATLADVLRYLDGVTKDIGGDIRSAYKFMEKYDLYDIEMSENKYDSSFVTYISKYESPFLFLSPVGYSYDYLAFAHEFGHFAEAYSTYNAATGTDLSETFSQGFEYISLVRNGLSDDEKSELSSLKLLDSLETYILQSSMCSFEDSIYSLPYEEVTVEKINELYRASAVEYGYYIEKYDDHYSKGWVNILHFYEAPCYIISYIVSNDAAMQIYELELSDKNSGVDAFEALLESDFSLGFIDSLEAAGLSSPFASGRADHVAQMFTEKLKEI